AAHPLETWGDARAQDGTVSLQQPLTQPLFGGVSENELLAAFLGEGERSAYQLLEESWRTRTHRPPHFDRQFQQWLADGVVPESGKMPVLPVKVDGDRVESAVAAANRAPAFAGFEVVFAKDPKAWDGRYANNAWMQELPHPVSKLAWDNLAYVSPATAARLGLQPVRSGRDAPAEVDVCLLELGGQKLEVAVMPLPGHADDCVTLPLGYGRTGAAEKVALGVGFNAYLVRRARAPWLDGGATLSRTDKRHDVALTQEHWALEGRSLLVEASAAQLQARPEALQQKRSPGQPPSGPGAHAWGMAVDLSRCTGCNACVLACQAENNIPVVGKAAVQRGREMHWLRIERYWSGDPDAPRTALQPMLCQHCEAAPCEGACPTAATRHSDEGLNEMHYDRCVGSRYCASTCPYKVRRFNFLGRSATPTVPGQVKVNPDVTVRARGVMEKCTFCVQRIERARNDARESGGAIPEVALVTACQQACPTQVFTFGNLKDASQAVTKLHADARRYDVLAELGTRPRVAYLAKLHNAGPEPAGTSPSAEGGKP
ncbi:MAG: hypothetical protein RL653_765, partial [Pseudomonadota bacterium]